MQAPTKYPVHDLIATRWSPYAYSDRPVSIEMLQSVFEAARWAPSSYNEQPWRFIVATREDEAEHARVLGCLVDANQAWARHVPVLALGIAADAFARNNKPNRHAGHDLGLAIANLCIEATARGLAVHQMAGIDPERAVREFNIPAGWTVYTGIAIGYADHNTALPDEIKQRDAERRPRKPLAEIVFSRNWSQPAPFAE